MTFLWPFIIRISKVVLGGAIKRASKRKWDDMLAQPFDKENTLDQACKQFKILNTSRLLLYVLYCKHNTEVTNSCSPPP